MSSISDILKKEMDKSNGQAKVVKVPKEMRPTYESLKKLETKIGAQIQANNDMRYRSMNQSKRLVKTRT